LRIHAHLNLSATLFAFASRAFQGSVGDFVESVGSSTAESGIPG
jgi:hypothetical protein